MTVTWARRVIASLLAAALTTVIAHASVVVAYFVANQMTSSVIPSILDYFVEASLFTFLFLFIAGMLGGLRSWYVALPVGVLVGILGPLVGTSLIAVQSGTALTGEVVGIIFSTLLGINALYAFAVFIATPSAGRALYARIVGYREAPRAAERRIALVRLPAKNFADGIVSGEERAEVDAERADKQWDAYVAAFEEHGWTTQEVSFAPDQPDSVFVEDDVVLFRGLAVMGRPAEDARRSEVAAVEETVYDLGIDVDRIMAPGTLEGGDVLIVGDTVYVGRSGRTNAEGIRQLRELVTPLGYQVVGVPHTSSLHLKSVVTALPDGTFIGDPGSIDEPGLFPGFIAAREPEGASVVVLSDDALLISAAAPETAAMLRELGYTVVEVDISEFEKRDGVVTGLSVRVR